MIKTVRGFIIHRREVTESSLILTVFTDGAGKLDLLAKGARRKKSPFVGRVELFSLCHLTYYENTRRGLNILSDIAVIHPFAHLRAALSSFILACSFSELIMMATGYGSRGVRLFDLACEIWEGIGNFPDEGVLRRYFELHLLADTGYGLCLDACAACMKRGRGLKHFSAAAGGMVCGACVKRYRDLFQMSAGSRAIFRYLKSNPLSSCRKIKLTSTQVSETGEVLRRAITYYLEREPRASELAIELSSNRVQQ